MKMIETYQKDGAFDITFNGMELTFYKFSMVARYLKQYGYVPAGFIRNNGKRIGRNFLKIM